jgi:elongation factor Ts
LSEEQKRPFNVNRVYDDICLYDQYTIDGSKRVREVIEEASKQLGAPIEIRGFVRMARGEGIEKKEQDFAKEVSDLVSGASKK